MRYLTLGQMEFGVDEEAQDWFQGESFNLGKLAETVQTIGPELVKAFAPQTQDLASRIPEQYRTFLPFDMGPVQPEQVRVTPQRSTAEAAIPWLPVIAAALYFGSRLLR